MAYLTCYNVFQLQNYINWTQVEPALVNYAIVDYCGCSLEEFQNTLFSLITYVLWLFMVEQDLIMIKMPDEKFSSFSKKKYGRYSKWLPISARITQECFYFKYKIRLRLNGKVQELDFWQAYSYDNQKKDKIYYFDLRNL